MPADLIASLSHNAHGIRAVTSRSIALYSTVNEFLIPVFIIDLVRIGVSIDNDIVYTVDNDKLLVAFRGTHTMNALNATRSFHNRSPHKCSECHKKFSQSCNGTKKRRALPLFQFARYTLCHLSCVVRRLRYLFCITDGQGNGLQRFRENR